MNKVLNMTYSSSITDIASVNSSFDKGVLKICYTGSNRNGSYFDKATLEKCIPTLYNCPIVCNYDRESDEIGGHDIQVVRTGDGDLKLVNMTVPVGVIPESANTWFEVVTENDGTEHEYLFAEALLWKRQEAYEKIKNDGFESQSMEIDVKDGELKDGIYHIYNFDFTAFCLLGSNVEPCFESASIELFSKQHFKEELSDMMKDLKDCFTKIDTAEPLPSDEVVEDTHPQTHSMEGGNEVLDNETKIIDETIEETAAPVNEQEAIEQFELVEQEAEVSSENEERSTEDQEQFELVSNVNEFVRSALAEVRFVDRWGDERQRYHLVDIDTTKMELYCEDAQERWHLYGFSYATSGDKVAIDYATRQRKKYAIVDFAENDAEPFAGMFEYLTEIEDKFSNLKEQFSAVSSSANEAQQELNTLREFKAKYDADIAANERNELFARFDELAGIEAFDELRENSSELSLEEIEEKCYALKGRYGVFNKQSHNEKAPKIAVDKTESSRREEKPYGGIVEELLDK